VAKKPKRGAREEKGEKVGYKRFRSLPWGGVGRGKEVSNKRKINFTLDSRDSFGGGYLWFIGLWTNGGNRSTKIGER